MPKKDKTIFCKLLTALVLLSSIFAVTARLEAKATLDERKLLVAKELTNWTRKSLQSEKALVAVVARKGGADVKKHDITGMAHSGLAVYDPRVKTYIVYNLVGLTEKAAPISKIYRTALVNFFYGQTGYEKNALILLPDEITQKRIYEALINGRYEKLFFTNKYNLLSNYASEYSLNCNKWLLMNVVAARTDNYQPEKVLKTISTGFNPGVIRLSNLEKFFVKRKRNVRKNEVLTKALYLVTIESLYKSKDLFPKSYFYKKL